jgi:hypothetical protein
MATGRFTTWAKTTKDLVFPEFSLSQVVHAQLHVTAERLSGYDLILGRDMLSALGIILDFSRDMIIWEEGKMPMKTRDSTSKNSFFVKEPDALHEEADKMSKILDAKYQKADLKNIAEITKGLTEEPQTQLWQFLNKYENLFDGTLGNWKGADYRIELREGVKPYHAKPYSVPRPSSRSRTFSKNRRTQESKQVRVGRTHLFNSQKGFNGPQA